MYECLATPLRNQQLELANQINIPYTQVDRKNPSWQDIVDYLWTALSKEVVGFDLNKFGKANRKLVEEDLKWLNKYIVGDLGKCYIKGGSFSTRMAAANQETG